MNALVRVNKQISAQLCALASCWYPVKMSMVKMVTVKMSTVKMLTVEMSTVKMLQMLQYALCGN